MFGIKYLELNKNELKDLSFISIVLGLLFSVSNNLFSSSSNSFFGVFILFTIFIGTLLTTRLIFMKFFAYKNAFEINLELTYFNRFWLNKYDKLNYLKDGSKKTTTLKKSKGIPMPIISILISILSLGTFIYTSIWNYKIKKIPHLHLGTQQKFEYAMGHMLNVETSDYRYSKVLFSGVIYYLLIGLFVKFFFEKLDIYFWLQFIVFWIGFVSLIPVFGSEGYELFRRSRFAWISAIVILLTGFFALLIFTNTFSQIIALIFSSIIILFYLLWRHLM